VTRAGRRQELPLGPRNSRLGRVFKLAPLPRTLPAALRDLDSKKTDVRVAAARDLGRLTGEDEQRELAVSALERTLARDSAAAVRAAAAEALADAGARRSVPKLMAALSDQSVSVRQRAVLALGELDDESDPEVGAAVLRALGDPAPELRFQALVALGRVRGRSATDSLLKGTRDSDPQVRYIAWRVLEEQWCEPDSRPGFPEPLRIRAKAALNDEAAAVRLAVAILLGRIGDLAGKDILIETVSSTPGLREPEDELAAVELVGELGLMDARAGLRRRAFGWSGGGQGATTFQARVALVKLGDERATQAILRDLVARSRDRRALAVAAAGQARLAAARGLLAAMLGNDTLADQGAVSEALERIDDAGRR
jgi:hypothetical protein